MSALEVKRTKGDVGLCANRCGSRNGLAAAVDHVTILGYPVGAFCPTCVKDMRAAWTGALSNWETDEPEMEHVRVFNRSDLKDAA